ncbi:filamentous hemagglutinin N-terminal domain-containing protein [Zoogloea sp.]|uniref:filamentous hemagglutinin N-terminal domain-containing protein n=1 Tax=Zoogloea sp. TaxID=49181 RepID=UPI001416C337|nr:MAG: filamentous hemagglutinin N-terminal domain-containing protein [Zoogloea sp.]
MLKRLVQTACCVPLALHAATGIVPDGSTATSTSLDPSGRTRIQVAPPAAGVSYNAFSRFDVDRAGAAFQNQDAGARTIVAEVRSGTPSTLEGPLSVEGPRANLIVANPNGLVVNGGSFVNFGSVALVAGSLALDRRNAGSGQVQVSATTASSAAGSAISIGPDGLAADLIRLELMARRIEVNGPLSNAYSSPTALVRLVAGDASVLFDTAASPTDNLTPWAYYSAGKTPGQGFLIDLGAQAKLSSGRIELLVTDVGAGVRNAGQVQATAGDLVLDSSGALAQRGGRIEAAGDIRIHAASLLQQQGEQAGAPAITASGSLDIAVTGSVTNLGGSLAGSARNPAEGASPGAVRIVAGGDIVNQTPAGGATAVLFGAGDDVVLSAGGDLRNINGRIVSNGALTVQVGGVALNESQFVPGAGRQSWSRDERTWLGLPRQRNGVNIDNGQLADLEHMAYWVAEGDVRITAGSLQNLGGYVFANKGDLGLDVAGGILNRAWLSGTVSFRESCNILFCRRSASSSERLVGGQILASGDVRIKGGETLVNDGGLILAAHDMLLDVPRVEANGVPVHVALSRSDGLRAFFGDRWAELYAIDQGGGFTAQAGRLSLTGEAIQNRGFVTAREGVDGVITVVRTPGRDPVVLSSHLGLFSALWR